MLAAWELSRRIWAARTVAATDAGGTHDAQAIEDLRRALARLPETRHPLGL
jgi:hypothetical protein